MHTSNIHEIRKKAAVSIAVKIITGHLLRTVWYNIGNIENRGLEGVGIIKRATCSSNGFTVQTGCQEKRTPTNHPHPVGGGLLKIRRCVKRNRLLMPGDFTANPMPRKSPH